MIFRKTTALSCCFGLLASVTAFAQATNNDGFQRRNGQIQVLRNGQARPMTCDIHLPTGSTVTKDGFVVGPDGKRTELREGQGCDLRGRSVALAPPASARPVYAQREAPTQGLPKPPPWCRASTPKPAKKPNWKRPCRLPGLSRPPATGSWTTRFSRSANSLSN